MCERLWTLPGRPSAVPCSDIASSTTPCQRRDAPTAIGPFTITSDADGNHIQTLGTGTSDQSQYLYDEETRFACANEGPRTPSPLAILILRTPASS